MQGKVIIDGKEYIGKDNDETNVEDAAEKLFSNIAKLDSYQMELQSGGFFIIGKEAIQRAVFIFTT